MLTRQTVEAAFERANGVCSYAPRAAATSTIRNKNNRTGFVRLDAPYIRSNACLVVNVI